MEGQFDLENAKNDKSEKTAIKSIAESYRTLIKSGMGLKLSAPLQEKSKAESTSKEYDCLKQFSKLEKVVIRQEIDHNELLYTNDCSVRFLLDGFTQSNKVYRVFSVKDISKFLMRNCVR